MTEKKLLARDAKRDIGAELLASVLEMKAGEACTPVQAQKTQRVPTLDESEAAGLETSPGKVNTST